MKLKFSQFYVCNRFLIIATFIWLFLYSSLVPAGLDFIKFWLILMGLQFVSLRYGITPFSISYNVTRKTYFYTTLLNALFIAVFNMAIIFCLNQFTSISIIVGGFRITNQPVPMLTIGLLISVLALHLFIGYWSKQKNTKLGYILAGIAVVFVMFLGVYFIITKNTISELLILIVFAIWFIITVALFRYFIMRIDLSKPATKKKGW